MALGYTKLLPAWWKCPAWVAVLRFPEHPSLEETVKGLRQAVEVARAFRGHCVLGQRLGISHCSVNTLTRQDL